MRDTISVEICINCDGPQDIEDSVGAAHAGGASTVELCSAMHFDGLTPSVDQLSAARRAFDNRPGLLVMIRPRQGNFLYSPKEIVAIHRQIEAAATAGADGVVFGALNEARCLALDVCRELIKTALASRPAGRPRPGQNRDCHRRRRKHVQCRPDSAKTSAARGSDLSACLYRRSTERQDHGVRGQVPCRCRGTRQIRQPSCLKVSPLTVPSPESLDL